MLLECFKEMLITKIFNSVYILIVLKHKSKFLYNFLNAKACRLNTALFFHKKSEVSLHFAFCNLEFFNTSIDPPKFFKV